ncbi:hypothetical protein [endosymbiont DhMRE of Dentiscutata heterogama]|uniref:hypothetical protein n=1 Tax=endosymbiont DhMRE of Dentiscutata heterogama TaxID=1609546 RepID=UPI002AD1DA04|nr:hypothetical protein [endosymbiont DhMRE of Dentiscutata heterogama]
MNKVKKVPQRGEMRSIKNTSIHKVRSSRRTSIPRRGEIWLIKCDKIKELSKD